MCTEKINSPVADERRMFQINICGFLRAAEFLPNLCSVANAHRQCEQHGRLRVDDSKQMISTRINDLFNRSLHWAYYKSLRATPWQTIYPDTSTYWLYDTFRTYFIRLIWLAMVDALSDASDRMIMVLVWKEHSIWVSWHVIHFGPAALCCRCRLKGARVRAPMRSRPRSFVARKFMNTFSGIFIRMAIYTCQAALKLRFFTHLCIEYSERRAGQEQQKKNNHKTK